MNFNAENVMSGTHAQIWLDSDLQAEAESAQAKVTINTEPVNLLGDMWEDEKAVSVKGDGSITNYHVLSRMSEQEEKDINRGKRTSRTLIMKLDDPDGLGAERVALYNVKFKDATLFDVKSKGVVKKTRNFSFRGFKYLDRVEEN